jgi:arylsulfatase A-like enzyme
MTVYNFKLLGFLLFIGANISLAQDIKKPNIIFIMTDDQSSIVPSEEDKGVQSRPFGFNGDKEVHTPVIDSLAKGGMIFNNAYVSSSVCSPSRYSMLTGRYASRSKGKVFMKQHPLGTMTRVENNTELENDLDNLPKMLQTLGYKTGFVGKSHIMEHDKLIQRKNWVKHGFKEFDKNADPNDVEVSQAASHNHEAWINIIKDYGFDYANAVYGGNLKEVYNDSLNVHNVEWKNKAALDFIDTNKASPFFLYYSETIPHGPAPWIKKNGKYTHGLDANPKFTGEGYVDESYSYLPSRQEIKDEIVSLGKDQDHAWLLWFDYAIGALVQKLKEEGIYDNTIIVITSDHGSYNYGKTTLYESGVKVPLLVHWPNGIKPNTVYNEQVQNIDIAPTFLDLAGYKLKKKHQFDGVSFKKVLFGSKNPIHDYLYFELGYARAVATKEWKYISVRYDSEKEQKIQNGKMFNGFQGRKISLPYYTRNSHLGYHSSRHNPLYFERDQLFDLVNDSKEQNNIYNENDKEVKKLKRLLIKTLESFPNRPYGEFVN